jgi:hypothetical protein
MPPADENTLYAEVAKIALDVATKHGFVLGGGFAWLVNGLVQRPTEDVDLFTDTAGGVTAAAGEVAQALTAAGYRVVREEGDELFAGMDEDLQEFLVAAPDRALRLTLCRLDRREVRDYIDVAAALERYSLATVLELAHAADPALDPEDIADAGRYLDRLDDARFLLYGMKTRDIERLRDRLKDWPRD